MTPLYKSGSIRKSESQVFESEIISYSAPPEEKGADESFGLEEAKQSMFSSREDRDLEELPMAGRLFRQEGEEIMDSKPRRPSVPSSSRSRVIAANEPSVRAIPVPEDEAPGLSLDFGNGDGFGDGFGDSGGSGHELGYSWSPKKAERDGRVAGRDEDRFEGSTAFSGVAGINIAGVIDAEGALFERGSEIANNGKKVQKPTATPLFSLEVADEGQREDSRFLNFSEYEPPELPNTATGGSVWSGEAKFPVTPATPRAWYFDKSIAEREIARRSSLVPSADASLLRGRDAYDEGDYVKAAEEYKKAKNLLPPGPALDDRRRAYSDHLNDANLALAQKYRRIGKYKEARNVLGAIIQENPTNEAALKQLEYLDDPIRTNPALTYEHTKKVEQIRKNLYLADGYLNLGKFDKAEDEMKKVLKVDPYNRAARRGLEKIAAAQSDFYRAAYDQTRAELRAEVDSAWAAAADNSKLTKSLVSEARHSKELQGLNQNIEEKSEGLAKKRRQLMDVAERIGVIWLESEKGEGKQMTQLELRDLAEKGLYDASREKEQLQAHINKLLKSSDDDLIKVAAELPDTGLKESYCLLYTSDAADE